MTPQLIHETLYVDRYQELQAIVLGNKLAEQPLAEETAHRIDWAVENYTFPQHSPSRGLIHDYIKRQFPPTYVNRDELEPVSIACSATLAVGGLRGAYYKVRGFKKAAEGILASIEDMSEPATS
jgi:hypothetical protein